jgi:hypothetical protein
MRGWVDLLLGVIAATAAALLLALLARDHIGMPPGMVREDALMAAVAPIATAIVRPRISNQTENVGEMLQFLGWPSLRLRTLIRP